MSLIVLNASLLLVCIFLVFVAGEIAHLSSDVESCMHIATPVNPDFVMYSVAQIRFIAASELPLSDDLDRKSTRLNSSHLGISYAVFCLKKKFF